jgi:hypothetical protein
MEQDRTVPPDTPAAADAAPPGFLPQPDLQPGQFGGVQTHESDLVADAVAEEPEASEADGAAEGDDDAAED